MTTTQKINALRKAAQQHLDSREGQTAAARKEINLTVARIESEMHALIQTL